MLLQEKYKLRNEIEQEDKGWVNIKAFLVARNLQNKTSLLSLADYRIGPTASSQQYVFQRDKNMTSEDKWCMEIRTTHSLKAGKENKLNKLAG